MTMVHVQTAEGRLHTVQVNPANVLGVSSPRHREGGAIPPYNAVITMIGGREVKAVEPRDVVFALIGNATMDTKSNPGYFHAVKGAGDDEWLIRRSDYETE